MIWTKDPWLCSMLIFRGVDPFLALGNKKGLFWEHFRLLFREGIPEASGDLLKTKIPRQKITWQGNNHNKQPLPATPPTSSHRHPPTYSSFLVLQKGRVLPTLRWRYPGESGSCRLSGRNSSWCNPTKLDSLLLRLPKLPRFLVAPRCKFFFQRQGWLWDEGGPFFFSRKNLTSPEVRKTNTWVFRLVDGELTVSTYRSSPSLPNTLSGSVLGLRRPVWGQFLLTR